MMGPVQQRAGKLFYTDFNLDERVPADHPLRQVRQLVNFEFVRQQVVSCYGTSGHVSLDPTLIIKLMFLMFYDNVRSERELMRQLPMRLDWLWFLDLDLDDPIPNHSVTSKARRRWGREVFESLFTQMLQQCVDAGLVADEAWHADSTLLRANASVDSRVSRKLWEQLERGLAMPQDNGDDEAKVMLQASVDDTLPTTAWRDAAQASQTSLEAMPTALGPAENDENTGKDELQCDSDQPTPAPASPLNLASRKGGDASQVQPRGRKPAFNRMVVSTTDPDAATTRRRGRGDADAA